MSKKKKKLTKAQRDKIIQSLIAQEANSKSKSIQTENKSQPTVLNTDDSDIVTTNKELKKILTVCAIVIALFATILIIDSRINYLEKISKFVVDKLNI